MSESARFQCSLRPELGSRAARKLRAAGRVPASLNSEGRDSAHVDLHLDESQFLASRRHHVHLYDLDIDGRVESAVVRELAWDSLGDRLVHIEFKRVARNVATESQVDLVFAGMVREGVANHVHNEITIRCLPGLIPDSIRVEVEGLTIGTHVRAKDLVLPEGVELAQDPETEILIVTAIREVAPAAPAEEGLAAPEAAPGAPPSA